MRSKAKSTIATGLVAGLAVFGSLRICVAESKPADDKEVPALTLAAQCGLPFRDNAVLQQEIPLPVWGTSLPGARVMVTFDTQTKTTVADADGNWRVVLDSMTAVKLATVNDVPVGKTMTIVCEKDGEKAVREISNLLVGEVWLCAGQSNMAGKMGRAGSPKHFPPDSIEKANYPALRQMISPKGEWLVCSPETAVWFKKVCFFFARRLQRDILVPVGVINAAVGGSKIEAWLNQRPPERGSHYDRMIAPLEGFGLRGVVWYQGESNASDGRRYQPKLESLITGWRAAWQQPDSKSAAGPRGEFSVYFVQLPGIGSSPTDNPAGGDGRADIRQACFETLAIKNTGMAVTIDIGDLREHPPNKYDTGIRLARLALHNDYGLKSLVPSGPLYKSHKIEGSTVRITFDNAQNGLMLAVKEGFLPPRPTPDARLPWLSIQGKDGTWHWADGKLEGSELVVSCKDVKEPTAVRYGYTQHPVGSLLYNKDGLPASPFSTNGYGDSASVRKGKLNSSSEAAGLASGSVAEEAAGGKHLFILSGQSNMAGLDPDVSFTPAVTRAFGESRVLVVKDAASGMSIRSWCKSNLEHPPPAVGRIPKVRGELYALLMGKVKAAIKEQTIQTVTFVWMQGESDLRNPAYGAYLQALIRQLQDDLDFKNINVVIGRISDNGLDRTKRLEERKFIRRTQVEFAESYPRGAWVDTDDLNDRKQGDKIVHDLHYTPEGFKILAERFAEEAIALIKKRAEK